MDLEVIHTVFTFGKFAALTPSSTNNHNPHCLQKLYEICVYLLYVVCFSASIYAHYPVYQMLTFVECMSASLYDLNQFCYVFYILIVLMRLRRRRWFRLIKSLAGVQSAKVNIPLKLVFVASQLFYYCLTIFGVYAHIEHSGLAAAASDMGEFYQFYAIFFYQVFTSVLLILLLSRYKRLSETLSQVIRARSQLYSKQVVEILKMTKKSIFTLKEGVKIFNDTFGWSFLFTIISCVSRTLIYIDIIIKHSEILLGQNMSVFYHDFCRILISWVKQFTYAFYGVTPLYLQVGILSTIFLCDSVMKKCDEILWQAYRLESELTSYENKEIQVFINVVLHNRPEFRAARFFSINRSTLFTVLNSLTTFLLVIIQFK
jgi:gustatory receptor